MTIRNELQKLKNDPEQTYTHSQSEDSYSKNYTNTVEIKYIPQDHVFELIVVETEGGEELERKTMNSEDEVLSYLNIK